jgi:purine-binding chemotaxis protein CheW
MNSREEPGDDGITAAEDSKRILRERRLKLAENHACSDLSSGDLEILDILVEGTTYGLELKYLYEARNLSKVTAIPLAPNWLKGVVYLRAKIVPVIDIAEFIGAKTNALSVYNIVVSVCFEDKILGLCVDELLGVRRISSSTIQDALFIVDDRQRSYLKGVLPDSTTLIDVRKIFEDPAVFPDASRRL